MNVLINRSLVSALLSRSEVRAHVNLIDIHDLAVLIGTWFLSAGLLLSITRKTNVAAGWLSISGHGPEGCMDPRAEMLTRPGSLPQMELGSA